MNNPFIPSEKERVKIVNQQKKDIKNLYKDAVNELSRQIGQLKRSTKTSSVERRQYLMSLRKELRSEFKVIDTKTENLIKSNADRMIAKVLQNNEQFLYNLGFSDFTTNQKLKRQLVDAVINGNMYSNKWTLSKAIWGDNAKKNEEIKNIVAKGILKNKSTYQIAKDLERYVNPQARIQTTWLNEVSGRRRKIDYNAQRLAQTMVSHAYEEAFIRVTKDNPFIEAYRWITSGSDKVCAVCIDRETGDHYGLGAGIYPKDKLPIDHPNGMCTFECVFAMPDEEMADAIADWYLGEGDSRMNQKIEDFLDDF